MTFQPDIFRQSFQKANIQLEQNLDTLTGADQKGTAQVAEQGKAMGYRLETEIDPNAQLLDSMEELSFQFEETELKSVSERELGENRAKDTGFLRKVEFWTRKFPDLPNHDFLLRLMRQARRGVFSSMQDFLRALSDGSPDPSHQFAMLECLEEAFAENPADAEHLQMVQDAKDTLVKSQGPEIQAGINLADEINNRSRNNEEMQNLRELYRSQILGFTTPHDCFRSLVEQRGTDRLAESLDFLLTACSVDLQATTPSTSTEELRRIILDLQCVEVLKSICEKFNMLSARMSRQFGETLLLPGEKMTGRILDMTKLPFMNSETIKGFVNACGILRLPTQLDFLRELHAIFRSLSPRLFEDNEARFRMVNSAQDYLDELIEKEEEEKEKEEKHKNHDK